MAFDVGGPEIDRASVRSADACRLGVAAFFATLLLTFAYGSIVGRIVAAPLGGVALAIGVAGGYLIWASVKGMIGTPPRNADVA